MSKKHERQLAVPHGDYYMPSHEVDGADLACVHARHDIVRAINRSNIPRELEALVVAKLHEIPEGRSATPDEILPFVDEWAMRWHLTDWMLLHGMLWFQWGGIASDFWNERRDSLVADELYEIPAAEGPFMRESQVVSLSCDDFSLTVPGCDVTETPIAVWKERVRAEVEQQLSDIEKDVRGRAAEAGLRPIKTGASSRRESTGALAEKYNDWFVSFQLAGDGYERISQRHGIPRQTVMDGVKSVAMAARVQLRNQKRGRPKGAMTDPSKLSGRNRSSHGK